MSDAEKPMVVWAHPVDIKRMAIRGIALTSKMVNAPEEGDRACLLLPIEDGALRVGDHLFRRIGMTDMFRTDSDPVGEWYDVDPLDLWDLLMDAVEGVEP